MMIYGALLWKGTSIKNIIQSKLDYLDSLGPHEIVRIIEGPDNQKYEYKEEQNRAKLIKLRKRHLIVKEHF